MVQIAGKYQHVRNENFLEYLLSIGVPEDRAKVADARKPTLEVAVDGNKISVNINSGDGEEKASSTFILGEEVDEALPNNITLKSTAKLNGDSLTVTSKTPSGKSGSRVYKFSDTELVLTMNNDKGPEGKRIYKRI
ncbi:fatty acid-binding protein, adipocyte-like [Tenebrio molitor]|uniref:fatty acid-binding protein, adipocyte-like n=1 Tax=Tenebrio molitor TaxID=7067 RepID=UPI00362477CF